MHLRLPAVLLLLLTMGVAHAAAQAPSTDIFILSVRGDRVGKPRPVTDREGYDNQPQFLPDGRRLVYSSQRAGETDIYIYDLKTGRHRRLLESPQSEYSPTPIPGQAAISVVRDAGQQEQHLWRLSLDGGEPRLLLPDVNPVGYHAWVDDQDLLLFVLGEPPTLQIAHPGPGPGRVIARSPGRALARIPGSQAMSFVDKSAPEWWLTAIDLPAHTGTARTGEDWTDTTEAPSHRSAGLSGAESHGAASAGRLRREPPASPAKRRLIRTLPGREDYAWAPDGSVWMGDDSRLYRWQPGEPKWRQLADLDAAGIHGITRLTFSPDGRKLALVSRRTPQDLAAAYRQPAGQILGSALTDVEGWEKLTYLTTIIGHRLSGSAALERAIDWAVERMKSEGLQVRKQPALVPHWVRGQESARVVSPVSRPLPITGLGDSVGTPRGGITAPVVVVGSFEELEALGREKIEGKIVLYAVAWEGYGRTVQFRSRGPSRAAALGAVAALTRSATGRSLATPHTGALRYAADQPKIPAAAVTVEDAAWMRRMSEMGREVRVHLQMDARMLPAAPSFNVIAEIPGSERPEEVVVMGGHYDSWDVGQGAHDDGASCMAAWQALRIMKQLGLEPRRTLRVVLWTNEENGGRGAAAYHDALSEDEMAQHVAAIEMDGGAERPVGFGFGLSGVDPTSDAKNPVYESAYAQLVQIGRLLEGIDASSIFRGGSDADIGPLMRSGVPGLELRTVGEHYFDWHHTQADTLDKVDIQDFRKAMAMLGVTGFVLADMPGRLVPAAR